MKKKKNKVILYLLDHKLKWKNFKILYHRMVVDSGPTLAHFDKMIWQMMRDKKIYCGFRSDVSNDMWIGTKIPNGFKIKTLTNGLGK